MRMDSAGPATRSCRQRGASSDAISGAPSARLDKGFLTIERQANGTHLYTLIGLAPRAASCGAVSPDMARGVAPYGDAVSPDMATGVAPYGDGCRPIWRRLYRRTSQ